MRVFLSKFAGVLSYMVQYGCIAHCTFEYFGDFVVCTGPSMEPTLHSNDILFTEHLSPRLNSIQKGDVIISKCPTNPNQHICKRVIGIAGDKVWLGFTSEIVPRGHIWLEGDNMENSADSRVYGPVPLGLVRSRAVCKIWPLSDATFLNKSKFSDNTKRRFF